MPARWPLTPTPVSGSAWTRIASSNCSRKCGIKATPLGKSGKMFNGFYQGKRVLVTGHTGFKGGWLSLWLKQLGAEVWGVSLPAPTQPSFHEIIAPHAFAGEIQCDIRQLEPLAAAVKKIQPDVVFHLAAQPIVRLSYVEP